MPVIVMSKTAPTSRLAVRLPIFGSIMTVGKGLPTAFLPPERHTQETVRAQHEMLRNSRLLLEMLDAIPHAVLVLNSLRQIVYTNDAFVTLAQPDLAATEGAVLGQRPGEVLCCEHLETTPGGCGTNAVCLHCGLAHAFIRAFKELPAVEECHILRKGPTGGITPLDLRVWTRPFTVEDETFVFVAAQDISDEQRRKTLEEIFFHDLGNTAGLIHGISELILDECVADGGELARLSQLLKRSAARLLDEVEAQQQLAAAENGSLVLQLAPCRSRALLEDVLAIVEGHPLRQQRVLELDPATVDVCFKSDPALISRILVNMVKNAIEATEPGLSVTLGCRQNGEQVQFWVHNPQAMPPTVQRQVFRRHFSTHRNGHGLGTYSMRLLGEQYLQGAVTFESSRTAGTTFFATFPQRSVEPEEAALAAL